MRRKHRWKILLGLTLAATLTSVVGWRWVQQHARERVKKQLEELSGAPVEIGHVRLGLFGVEISGIRLLELGDNASAWLTVDRILLQLPVWKALAGKPEAGKVIIETPIVQLSFDQRSQLLDRLPTNNALASGPINITNGRVVLTQDGREPLIASGIDLRIHGPTRKARIAGQIGDLLGTEWKIESDVDGTEPSTGIRVSAARLVLDTSELSTRAWIPEGFWDQLRVSGATSASATAKYDAGKPLKWRIELQPSSMTVDVPELSLQLRQVAGKIRLDEGVLIAEELSCGFLGGTMTATGQLDLRVSPYLGQCIATIRRVSLDRLPAQWSVPTEVAGDFDGKVELQLAVTDNELVASGKGRGVIERATVLGMPAGDVQAAAELGRLTYDLANESVAVDGALSLDLQTNELGVNDVLSRLGVSPDALPFALEGLATLAAHVDVPLGSLGDTATYSASADIAVPQLSIDGERITNVRAVLNYAEGVAELNSVTAHVAERGRASASATVRVGGTITGRGSVEHLPLSLVAKLWPQSIELPDGTVSGQFGVHGPSDRWPDMKAWEVQGDFRSDKLAMFEQALTECSLRLELRNGSLLLKDLRAGWNDTTLSGNATVNTAPPNSFMAHFKLAETSAADLLATFDRVRLPEGMNAQLSVSGEASGQLTPFLWSVEGTAHARDAELAEITIPETDFAWQAAQDAFRMTANNLRMFGGQIDVDADIPFAADRSSQATFTLRRFNIAEAAMAIGGLPNSLVGEADGQLTLINFHDTERLTATGNLKGASARLQTITVDQLAADFSVSDGLAKFRLTGVSSGGHVEFAGTSHLGMPNSDDRVTGQLTVREARLSRLSGHLGRQLRNQLEPLDGQLAAKLQVILRGPDFQPEGNGSITLLDVKWDRRELASKATATIELTPDEIKIRDFDATLGDESVRGELTANLKEEQRGGSFRLTASRVNAKRLLAPWPTIAEKVDGAVDARIRGELGTAWTGTGQFSAVRARVVKVPVRFSRVPIDWSYWPSSARGRLKVRETAIQLANGRATTKSTIEWGRTLNVSVDARLKELDLKSLLRPTLGNTGAASGRLSGTLQLRGRNVRSFQSLQGSFAGTLEDAQALRLPVLRSTSQFLDAGQFGSTSFDSSEVKIRLAKGVVSIDRLAMASRGVQLLIDGNVVGGNRLDLNVTANVGQLDSRPELRPLLRFAGFFALPAAPVAVLAEANEFLSDRLIFLHIGGTIRSPTTRLRAAPLLQQEAVRFFLNQATGGEP